MYLYIDVCMCHDVIDDSKLKLKDRRKGGRRGKKGVGYVRGRGGRGGRGHLACLLSCAHGLNGSTVGRQDYVVGTPLSSNVFQSS